MRNPTPTIRQRLRAIWRILRGRPRTVWTRVEWQTAPLADGNPGYICSVYLGMSDLGSVVAVGQEREPVTFGAQVEARFSATPYVSTEEPKP